MAKAKQTKDVTVRHVAHIIAASIAALPRPVTTEHVLTVMQSQQCSKDVLCDAFWKLDNEPSRFPNYLDWHPYLRSLRNHPTDGERMFALFQ